MSVYTQAEMSSGGTAGNHHVERTSDVRSRNKTGADKRGALGRRVPNDGKRRIFRLLVLERVVDAAKVPQDAYLSVRGDQVGIVNQRIGLLGK